MGGVCLFAVVCLFMAYFTFAGLEKRLSLAHARVTQEQPFSLKRDGGIFCLHKTRALL